MTTVAPPMPVQVLVLTLLQPNGAKKLKIIELKPGETFVEATTINQKEFEACSRMV